MKNKTPRHPSPLTFYLLPFTCLLFTLCTFSCREKSRTADTATANTEIEWTRKTWNFGDISEGEEVSHTYYFRNTGQHNLIIKNIDTGCGCTTVNYDKTPLAPGKEGKLEIAFNSAGRYGKQYKEICIFANITGKQVTLSFTANVR